MVGKNGQTVVRGGQEQIGSRGAIGLVLGPPVAQHLLDSGFDIGPIAAPLSAYR